MADKKILFQLEIEGADNSVRTVNELTAAIKATTAALKETELGTDEYRRLEKQLGSLKNAQKDVSDSAKLSQRALEADAESGQRTYRQLNAQLVNARALFKELTEEERRGQIGQSLIADIKRLDAELKDIDATIGQFQRNVGNYTEGFRAAFSTSLPGFNQLGNAAQLVNDGIAQIGQTAGATGKLLVGAFIGAQVVGAILDGVQAVSEFADEINRLRGQLGQLSGESGEALDKATASVQAIQATFNAGTEETIQAANALDKAFDDIDLQGAIGLIESGFLSGANAGGELLDVLKEYPRLFDQMGFSAEEFLAIQAKAAQEGVFSDKGVDAVKEFGIRIREQTVATKTALEQAFGQDFTQTLFKGLNDGSLSVRDALIQVSTQLKNTELPAQQLQQVISDVFGGPGEDAGDDFLKSLADVEQGLDATIDASDEYTARLIAQLEAEKELAAAKIEVTNQLNELTGGYSTLGASVQTFGIKTLTKFLEALQPVRDALGRVVDSVVSFARQIGILPKEGEAATGFLDILGGLLGIVGNAIAFVVDGFRNLAGGLTTTIQRVPILNTLFQALGAAIRFVGDVIGNFPAYFAGAVEAAKQFATNVSNFFRGLVVDAQILFAELQKINPFNDNDAQLDRQIQGLKARKGEIQQAGRTVAEAFKAGFDSVKKPELTIVDPNKTSVAPKDPGGKRPPGVGAGTAEQIKKEADLQKAALEAQERYNDQRVELLRALSRRLIDAQIEAIDSESERQIAAERQKFEDLKAELAKQEAQLIAQQQAARKKIVAAFGVGSTQAHAFDQQAAADLEAAMESARRVTEANEQNHLERIEAIRNEAANNAAMAELERIKAQLSNREKQFEDAARREETRAKAQINRILNDPNLTDAQRGELVFRIRFEADAASIQQAAISVNEQIEQIEARIDELSAGDAIEQASIEEFEFLLDQADSLYSHRADLERQYTEVVNAESQRRQQAYLEEAEKAFQGLGQIVALVDGFVSASTQRELESIAEKEAAREQSIESLKNQLQDATGAEKKALESKIAVEEKALKKLADEREKLEKEEGKRQKAFAIIQSIITTALNIVKALGTPPVPNFAAAALAGALGAAQTAIIAAQPAATGGLIGLVKQQDDGLVVAAPNIPQMENGDNVLATIKRGEVVLNKKQQAALGGAPTFRAINVPGFAEGGVAGALISAPDISGTSSAERIRLLEEISGRLTDFVAATNGRIDRMRVFVVSEDVREDLAEGDAIEARAVLSAE
jgi:hypothetical protein